MNEMDLLLEFEMVMRGLERDDINKEYVYRACIFGTHYSLHKGIR
jgi:hypothetical protein